MNQTTDFAEVFARLARDGHTDETTQLDGVTVRLVRLKGGHDGRWDHHDRTTETVIVWSGDFDVEFRDHIVHLSAGQCCVVPVAVEHRGTSKTGAEIILFQQSPDAACISSAA